MKHNTKSKPRKHPLLKFFLVTLPLSLLLTLSFVAFFSAKWYVNVYGQLGFDSILYTLLSNLNGVESGLVSKYLSEALTPALCCSIPLCFVLFISLPKRLILEILSRFRIQLFPIRRIVAILLSLILSVFLIDHAAKDVELGEYIKYISTESTFYQEYYQDPKTTKITFPEKKRNLIYIFLESFETTFFSQEQGGFLPYEIAPELYQLATENTSFSNTDGFGGIYSPGGTGWTIGAMVGQTAAIPLKMPPGIGNNDYGANNVFLPGVTTITDILHENGYYQALMVGSDANFGGRAAYYSSHGTDRIYDLHTARADKLIPEDYYVWWGYEDEYLFTYAKQVLSDISQNDQPFALTMLTVDTHHPSGYVCENCDSAFTHQYENVISCSSKQVAEFVSWIQEQDFYENTTVIVVGDHPTMDNQYIQAINAWSYDRRMYNCFINSAVDASSTTRREAFTTDMFPTTLAAIGCTIEGERLGLGTNLFSDTPTLAEIMGLPELVAQMSASSSYYTSNFFFAE